MSKKDKSGTFCPLPWISLLVSQNGLFRGCCEMNNYPYGKLEKDDGSDYYAHLDDWNEARNSETLAQIRKQMLNGEKPSACSQCWLNESKGLQSKRKVSLEHFELDQDYAEQNTNDEGFMEESNIPLKYLDVRLGNLCNLACPSCSPKDSSGWYNDAHKLGMDKFDLYGSETYKIVEKNNKKELEGGNFDFYVKDTFNIQLNEHLKDIRSIYFTGGEPLINKKHKEILEYCVENDLAQNISLEYNTNCTVPPERFFELWKHFQKIHVACSIDGLGETTEWLRYPARWKTLKRNIFKIDNYPYGNLDGNITPTISVFNIAHMPDLIQWCINQNFQNLNIVPTNHTLDFPKMMNFKVLGENARHEVHNIWDKFFKGIEQNYSKNLYRRVEKTFKPILNKMDSEYFTEYKNTLLERVEALDNIRNIDYREMMPEFFRLIHLD